jgi:hypothetical protein
MSTAQIVLMRGGGKGWKRRKILELGSDFLSFSVLS